MNRKLRLAYVVSHPIQYQAPLLRRLAEESDISLTVFFGSDFSAKEYKDDDFGGIRVKWDVPLLEGYQYEYLPALWHSTRVSFWAPINSGIYRALKKGQFDVVWLHGYWNINCLVTMVAAKLLGMPLLERAEGTLIDHSRSGLKRAMKCVFFSIARHFIAAVLPISTRNRDYWAHYLGSDFPAFMVPYAVDNAYFQSMVAAASHAREEFRQQLGLERGHPIILYASKLMSRKRCMDLIEAYMGIKPVDGKRPYLLIVGDGSERALCEARVRAVGESGVRFCGFQNQSQLAQFYDLCDLFVLPSEYEPFGLIVNEVMNAGKAIIVSDEVGCRPDLVKDGVNGRVFPAGDVEALRTVLKNIVGDPEVRCDMGRRSLERINQWSFEEDIRGLRKALNHLAGLPLKPDAHRDGTIQLEGAEGLTHA